MTTTKSRGLRNNNPGNIRKNARNKWQGLAPKQPDRSFVSFQSPQWGIRALAVVLISYYDKYSLRTPKAIINRWAPPSENDTTAYAEAVASGMGCAVDSKVNMHDYADLMPMVKAIITHENGVQPYDQDTLDEALAMAGVRAPQPKSVAKTGTGKGVGIGALATIGGTGATLVGQIADQASPVVDAIRMYGPYVAGFIVVCVLSYLLYRRVKDMQSLRRP